MKTLELATKMFVIFFGLVTLSISSTVFALNIISMDVFLPILVLSLFSLSVPLIDKMVSNHQNQKFRYS